VALEPFALGGQRMDVPPETNDHHSPGVHMPEARMGLRRSLGSSERRQLRRTFHELWHRLGVRSAITECLHGALAFPYRQSPERSSSIHQEPSAQKAGCAPNLPLTAKCHPQKRRNIFQRSNTKTGNRCEHASAPKENSNEIFLDDENRQGFQKTAQPRSCLNFCLGLEPDVTVLHLDCVFNAVAAVLLANLVSFLLHE
jgi:hypothetical protein